MADYEMYEREAGFALQLDCWFRYENERAESKLTLAADEDSAIVTVINARNRKVITEQVAAISSTATNHFEYALTEDDFAVLTRGEYIVGWRTVVDGAVHEFQKTLLVKPSMFRSTSVSSDSGLFFDLEDNSGLVAVI